MEATPTRCSVRIGDVVIDPGRRRIDRDGSIVELPQRPFDLLCLFLDEPRTLHTRKDLFRRVWKGVVVEDANLSQGVWVLRRALGPQGKDWIRTVAKSGYVFDPPVPIEILAEPGADVVADTVVGDVDTATSTVDVPAPPLEPAVARRVGLRRPFTVAPLLRSWRLIVAAAGLLAFAAVASILWPYARSSEPLRVMLISLTASEGAAPGAPQWPVQLLREWLEWKLSREPGVVVVSASQLAGADERGRIVLLSVGDSPAGGGRLRLQAYISDTDRSDLTVDALPADMPQAADSISSAVASVFAPTRSGPRYAPLTLDLDAVNDYIVATQRRAARRPAEAISAFESVLKRAPGFGLARVQMAEVLDELGQIGAARQQIAFAQEWISRLPPVALRIQQAKNALLLHEYEAAATAYAALAAEYPRQPQFRLVQARALTLARRTADAQRALDAIDWNVQPLPLRLDALLARADAQRESGALDAAKKTAAQADKVATDAGWPLERGRALLILANASTNDDSREKWLPFDRAADQFALAGDRMSMLRARLAGETMQPFKLDAEADARLAALLGEARTAGNREIEVDALRLESRRYRRSADFTRARELLIEASTVAHAAGDNLRDSALQRDLALVSMGMADYPAAEKYLAEFDAMKSQAGTRLQARQLEMRLSNRMGRYDRAEELFKALIASPVDASTISAAMLHCDHAHTLLARGDLATSRVEADTCTRSGLPYDVAAGNLALAAVAVASGDNADALRRIDAALPSLDRLPDVDRWDLGAMILGLRARAGVREGIAEGLREILPHVAPGHMRGTEIEARLGLAELGLAQGELDAVDAQLEALHAIVPADDWHAVSRLAMIDAVRDQHRGDPKRARERLLELDQHARAIGDVSVELRAHSLADSWNDSLCPESRNLELLATSGMRGVSNRWLLGDRLELTGERARLAFDRPRTKPDETR